MSAVHLPAHGRSYACVAFTELIGCCTGCYTFPTRSVCAKFPTACGLVPLFVAVQVVPIERLPGLCELDV